MTDKLAKISALQDIELADLVDGQFLCYDATSGKIKNVTVGALTNSVLGGKAISDFNTCLDQGFYSSSGVISNAPSADSVPWVMLVLSNGGYVVQLAFYTNDLEGYKAWMRYRDVGGESPVWKPWFQFGFDGKIAGNTDWTYITSMPAIINRIAQLTMAETDGLTVLSNSYGNMDLVPPNTRRVPLENTVVIGDLLYLKSNGDYGKAIATSLSTLQNVVMAYEAGAGIRRVLDQGVLGGFSGLTIGPLYVSPTTAGAYTSTAPSTSGQFVKCVGYAISATEIMFNPDNMAIELK